MRRHGETCVVTHWSAPQPPQPPQPPPPQAVSTQELPLCVACCETPAVGLMAGGAGTSAMRRRQRRLRSWLRHERQTVAMELAWALHHSRDARSEVAHEAQKVRRLPGRSVRTCPGTSAHGPRRLVCSRGGSVRMTVFSSAIVIDVIVHCHTAGAL